MDDTKLIYGLSFIVVILILSWIIKNDQYNFANQVLEKKEAAFLKKKKEYERELDSLNKMKIEQEALFDSLYQEIEIKNNEIARIKRQTNSTIKKLNDEKSIVYSWNLAERDSFWARESERKEHTPDTIKINN